MANTVYTHDEASRIIVMFEDLLEVNDMKIPSVDDGIDYEIDDEERSPIYGTEYSNLQDEIEGLLKLIIWRVQHGYDVVTDEYGGTF